MAVLVKSLSVVYAGARRLAGASGVSTADAYANESASPLKVDRLDASIDTIVPANATMERVATGFTWVEGPIWIPAGYLMFAEITSNSIRKLTPDATLTIFMQPRAYKGTPPFVGMDPS